MFSSGLTTLIGWMESVYMEQTDYKSIQQPSHETNLFLKLFSRGTLIFKMQSVYWIKCERMVTFCESF